MGSFVGKRAHIYTSCVHVFICWQTIILLSWLTTTATLKPSIELLCVRNLCLEHITWWRSWPHFGSHNGVANIMFNEYVKMYCLFCFTHVTCCVVSMRFNNSFVLVCRVSKAPMLQSSTAIMLQCSKAPMRQSSKAQMLQGSNAPKLPKAQRVKISKATRLQCPKAPNLQSSNAQMRKSSKAPMPQCSKATRLY